MGWLSKLFGKKEKMSLKEKTLDELKELLSTKDFQWLKGDQMGSVEKYQDVVEDTSTGMIFVCFTGGGRMNIELLQEYMEMFPTQRVNFEPAPQVQPAFPEAPSIITTTQNHKPNRAVVETNQVSEVEIEESPIYKLLKKQKNNWVSVTISLKLNLPPKSLYSVLVSSFDDAENEIIDYVTEGIDIEDIRSALGKSILAYYEKPKNQSQESASEKNTISKNEE
jgi:hypothetical protein